MYRKSLLFNFYTMKALKKYDILSFVYDKQLFFLNIFETVFGFFFHLHFS